VSQFPCLSDNYGYLVHDPATGETAAVDTPCGKSYKEELDRRGWKLTHVLNTHHHWDHTGGNLELKEDGVKIYGPKNEAGKIPGIDVAVAEGDSVKFGGRDIVIMDGGGHTKGHIVYYIPGESPTLFSGDCLFSLGCGKMFEGNPEQFWGALEKLRDLPDETILYCAHEYTQSNGKFAMSVEPGNEDLQKRVEIVRQKRLKNEPTVPTLLGEEKKANPFLRVDFSEEIRNRVGATANDTPAIAFGKLRKAKDRF